MRILMRNNRWAFYIRLSREDGDRAESLSVVHQKLKLSEYAKTHPELTPYSWYIDDGYTGTNYDRPAFLRLLQDIEAGHICGVLVKDLSRLGRNNVKTSHYVHEYFPGHKVRFIAIDDAVDKDFFDIDTSKDMMIDLKNMFNGFYPRDISAKVRSTFRAKQCAGQFIGAFAAYGYRKSPSNHNKLLIDEPAAAIVRRIFCEYLSGIGASQIAKRLNEEQIPCPSLYKQMHEMAYHNANVCPGNGWTYSSVRNILRNPVYTGNMVQNRSFRQVCSKKALPPASGTMDHGRGNAPGNRVFGTVRPGEHSAVTRSKTTTETIRTSFCRVASLCRLWWEHGPYMPQRYRSFSMRYL